MGIVMMAVTEKDSQPKGSFGLQHPERWSPDAVDFLSKMEFLPVEELAQVIQPTVLPTFSNLAAQICGESPAI
jgi:hypothetical protein